ncbi:hypothetical protein [Spirillospora sp. NPDC029432]|uniref:hypothetical protein n=1 Tax=Spirillospora sp. NPDC029432 TaxID=3154599 RepID=UPI003454B8B8
MRSTVFTTLACAVLLGLGAAPAAAGTGWQVAHTSPGFPQDEFGDIAATGPDDAWAVGSGPCCGAPGEPQKISRWDGTAWRDVAAPAPPGATSYATLTHVGASSPRNAWVFGIDGNGLTYGHRWDGTAWRTSVFEEYARIHDTAVTGPRSAWVVGMRPTADGEEPVSRRWDGQGWTVAPMPVPAQAVSDPPRGRPWAIGQGEGQPVVAMRWTGSAWRTVPLPKPELPPDVDAYPGDILALAPDDIWASAVLGKGESVWPGAVLWHWNGRRWRQVRIDAPRDSVERLASDGRGGLWIASTNVHESSYLLHYSKGRVTRHPAPLGDGTAANVQAIARVPGTGTVLAAGRLHGDNSGAWAATVWRYAGQ